MVGTLQADRVSGKLPLSINLSVDAEDPDGDEVKYLWHLDNAVIETREPKLQYTYTTAGEYDVVVEVMDKKKGRTLSNELQVVAGNERPLVQVNITGGNSSFFMKGIPVSYEVTVTDGDGTVNPADIYVSVDYMESLDEAELAAGHQQVEASQLGKALIETLDCVGCHRENETSIGPSYTRVAQKYKDQQGAYKYLSERIAGGGTGVWGEVTMPAHPNLSKAEIGQIVAYIQSLAEQPNVKPSLPLSGTLVPDPSEGDQVMMISASYTDQGSRGIAPLTGRGTYTFKSNSRGFTEETERDNLQHLSFGGQELLLLPEDAAWFMLENVDLTNVKMVGLMVGWQDAPSSGIGFEIRTGAIDGPVIGQGMMPKPTGGTPGGLVPVVLTQPQNGPVDKLFFVHQPGAAGARGPNPVALVNVLFQL